MTLVEAAILGLVQGLTEFLPISSSGHLALAQQVLGIGGSQNLAFDVFLHVATLFAVMWSLRTDVQRVATGVFTGGVERRLALTLIIAMVPTAVIALSIQTYAQAALDRPEVVGAALILTGVVLFLAPRFRTGVKSIYDIKPKQALVIGAAQGIAVIPGLSRSGLTIGAAIGMGVVAEAAARFSFLLSILAITAAMAVTLLKQGAMAGLSVSNVAVGMLAAWLAGVLSIKWLLRIARRGRFDGFAYYCWGVGAITLIMMTVRHLTAQSTG